jgi:hypothetical protein
MDEIDVKQAVAAAQGYARDLYPAIENMRLEEADLDKPLKTLTERIEKTGGDGERPTKGPALPSREWLSLNLVSGRTTTRTRRPSIAC